ncbi:hypothetical protein BILLKNUCKLES_56 [Mycobacterium phage BillKnuckles]|uniref:Uncharacterized protein n=1 Tax=Mycobacterium phage BillKnuckles TaxID=2902892 RepID=G8I6K3_9CAUD|nr:hypothetical protein CM11_gp56 [Mycobacterium phage BillKnuckles]AER48347.1 hypothetical protein BILLKNUCKLES_56 [Mycobacterium phage BillKnuckles]QGJ90497.1 hypothetical protein SEA_TRAFT412_61 [Mycobacterium phage Traft412]WAB09648.1 hypothetical protein PBI_LICORICE_60 [Mycobacterium phage Licorice]
MTAIPTARPNLLRQQILSELLANRTVTRTETQPKKGPKDTVIHPVTGEKVTYQTYVDAPVDRQVPGLAGHVSEENIDRLARRWGK